MKKILLKLIFSLILCTQVFFSTAQNQKNLQTNNTLLDPVYRDFRISLGGGYAYRLGERKKESDPKLEQLSKDLMHGYNLDMDIQYFFKENWGLGINANYVGSNASASGINIPDLGSLNKYKESNKFLYIGPTFNLRYDVNKFLFLANMGFGPIFYTNDINLEEYTTIRGTKTTFGYNMGIGGEYKMSPSLGLGLKLSYTIGTIESLNYEYNRKINFSERMSVSNFMITGFLSFRTWK